ncbi:hypothetical protein [Cupriavidus metallidurans]|uniref:hypothetical protein n=1 Tax=Cupriavidus metallidurans TaxID=119219 RepID=UPI001CCA8734|nr:hypothetical protein [Cupriavidus metallidurans]UBM12694.1 hypothetical protein LAI70_28180 [Cupriavidus metallidurans]
MARTSFWTVILPSGERFWINSIPRNKAHNVAKVFTGDKAHSGHTLILSSTGRLMSPQVNIHRTVEGPLLKSNEWILRGLCKLGVITEEQFKQAQIDLIATLEQREINSAVDNIEIYLAKLDVPVPKQLAARFKRLRQPAVVVRQPDA